MVRRKIGWATTYFQEPQLVEKPKLYLKAEFKSEYQLSLNSASGHSINNSCGYIDMGKYLLT